MYWPICLHFTYLFTHLLLYPLYIHMRSYPLTRQVTEVKPNINLIGVSHPQLSHNSLFPWMDEWIGGWMDGWMWTYYTHSTLPKIKFRSPLRNFLHARFLKGDRKEPVGERPKGWGGLGTCKKLTLKKVYGLYGQSRDGQQKTHVLLMY